MDLFIAKEIVSDMSSTNERSETPSSSAELKAYSVPIFTDTLSFIDLCKQQPDLTVSVTGRINTSASGSYKLCSAYPNWYNQSPYAEDRIRVGFHRVGPGFWAAIWHGNYSEVVDISFSDELTMLAVTERGPITLDNIDGYTVVKKLSPRMAVIKASQLTIRSPQNRSFSFMKFFPFASKSYTPPKKKWRIVPTDEYLRKYYPGKLTVNVADCYSINNPLSVIGSIDFMSIQNTRTFMWRFYNVNPPYNVSINVLDHAFLIEVDVSGLYSSTSYHSRAVCVDLPTTTPVAIISLSNENGNDVQTDPSIPCDYVWNRNTGGVHFTVARTDLGSFPVVEAVYARRICLGTARYNLYRHMEIGKILVLPLEPA